MTNLNKTGYVSPMDECYRDGVLRPVINTGEIISVADNSGVKNCQIPPPIGTPLIKGGRGDRRQDISSIN